MIRSNSELHWCVVCGNEMDVESYVRRESTKFYRCKRCGEYEFEYDQEYLALGYLYLQGDEYSVPEYCSEELFAIVHDYIRGRLTDELDYHTSNLDDEDVQLIEEYLCHLSGLDEYVDYLGLFFEALIRFGGFNPEGVDILRRLIAGREGWYPPHPVFPCVLGCESGTSTCLYVLGSKELLKLDSNIVDEEGPLTQVHDGEWVYSIEQCD